jgi:A/G-specific adenine glycosylase
MAAAMSGCHDHSPLAAEVIGCFDRHARDLPWRRPGTTPWAVLVSEMMLQQTPVVRVLPVYLNWLDRWPTPAALAAASSGEAVRLWGKLGYPRRALRLHACAVTVTARHGGRLPSELSELLTLPGVGDYTARAVLAFAFGQRVPVVDTNIRRVIARAVQARALPGAPSATRDLAAMQALLPAEQARAARFCAAMMELGALVCTASSPDCPSCPLAAGCAWRRAGSPPADGPAPRTQRFAGTDRQVRGLLLDVLRGADGPVSQQLLDAVWPAAAQRQRAQDSLVADGLLDPLPDGRFALPS